MTVRNPGAISRTGAHPQALANRVVWSEGMYLRPQHFQQLERYVEQYVTRRTAGCRVRTGAGCTWTSIAMRMRWVASRCSAARA